MNSKYIIAGTDTDIGKTVFAAGLAQALQAYYWKPIQSGTETRDTDTVKALSGLSDQHFFNEAYCLTQPLSPHRAAEIDGITINPSLITPPITNYPLIIELAGGLMVPITRNALQIDMIKPWNIPVILCARTNLGTINHTLLSIQALQSCNIPIHGIAFIGDDYPDTIKTIQEISGQSILGRLPIIDLLTPQTLAHAFKQSFEIMLAP